MNKIDELVEKYICKCGRTFYAYNIFKDHLIACQLKKAEVIDLDNPENNCTFCGVDHHYQERHL